MFFSQYQIMSDSWQAFERNLCRLLMYDGFSNVRLVGESNDHGADVLAIKAGKRWLFQAKHWSKPVGLAVAEETIRASYTYHADVPVIVATSGFDSNVKDYMAVLQSQRIPLQLWDSNLLIQKASGLPDSIMNQRSPYEYQESAIQEVVRAFFDNYENRALIVMATGLGKTFVAAESIRRIRSIKSARVLVCAHMNNLVYQLEKAFWPFLKPSETTLIWNSSERPSYEKLENTDFCFACVDSVYSWLRSGRELPNFDILLIDECHHVGTAMYDSVFEELHAGKEGGAFALGLTATPWRADEVDPREYFGEPRINIDIIYGLQHGALANVDYRMYTDNINWDALKDISGKSFTPRQINKTLFIDQWDDAVVYQLRDTWKEQPNPRAIVFCGTIEHAIVMRDKVNQLGFCKAEAIFSGGKSINGERMNHFARNRIMSDFEEGLINVICAVDIFNEGIDVPDVNILVFQRVTHTRRIFIQQLGRGLRIS